MIGETDEKMLKKILEFMLTDTKNEKHLLEMRNIYWKGTHLLVRSVHDDVIDLQDLQGEEETKKGGKRRQKKGDKIRRM